MKLFKVCMKIAIPQNYLNMYSTYCISTCKILYALNCISTCYQARLEPCLFIVLSYYCVICYTWEHSDIYIILDLLKKTENIFDVIVHTDKWLLFTVSVNVLQILKMLLKVYCPPVVFSLPLAVFVVWIFFTCNIFNIQFQRKFNFPNCRVMLN